MAVPSYLLNLLPAENYSDCWKWTHPLLQLLWGVIEFIFKPLCRSEEKGRTRSAISWEPDPDRDLSILTQTFLGPTSDPKSSENKNSAQGCRTPQTEENWAILSAGRASTLMFSPVLSQATCFLPSSLRALTPQLQEKPCWQGAGEG